MKSFTVNFGTDEYYQQRYPRQMKLAAKIDKASRRVWLINIIEKYGQGHTIDRYSALNVRVINYTEPELILFEHAFSCLESLGLNDSHFETDNLVFSAFCKLMFEMMVLQHKKKCTAETLPALKKQVEAHCHYIFSIFQQLQPVKAFQKQIQSEFERLPKPQGRNIDYKYEAFKCCVNDSKAFIEKYEQEISKIVTTKICLTLDAKQEAESKEDEKINQLLEKANRLLQFKDSFEKQDKQQKIVEYIRCFCMFSRHEVLFESAELKKSFEEALKAGAPETRFDRNVTLLQRMEFKEFTNFSHQDPLLCEMRADFFREMEARLTADPSASPFTDRMDMVLLCVDVILDRNPRTESREAIIKEIHELKGESEPRQLESIQYDQMNKDVLRTLRHNLAYKNLTQYAKEDFADLGKPLARYWGSVLAWVITPIVLASAALLLAANLNDVQLQLQIAKEMVDKLNIISECTAIAAVVTFVSGKALQFYGQSSLSKNLLTWMQQPDPWTRVSDLRYSLTPVFRCC